MACDPKTAPNLKEMRGDDGKPKVCDKFWISSIGCAGDDMTAQKGKLTAGFGASTECIGPEFTIGIFMEKLGDPVLIIKTSWGGMDLHTAFRSPGAGPYVWGDFALGLATRRGDTAAVACLLSVGADPHLQNSEGTAIHKAVCSDNTEIAGLLLEAGVNINAQNGDKWTCLWWVNSRGNGGFSVGQWSRPLDSRVGDDRRTRPLPRRIRIHSRWRQRSHAHPPIEGTAIPGSMPCLTRLSAMKPQRPTGHSPVKKASGRKR